jgi:hypothetical protein
VVIGLPNDGHVAPNETLKTFGHDKRRFHMNAIAFCVVLLGVIAAMAVNLRRSKLPAETTILVALLDRLQTSPGDSDRTTS